MSLTSTREYELESLKAIIKDKTSSQQEADDFFRWLKTIGHLKVSEAPFHFLSFSSREEFERRENAATFQTSGISSRNGSLNRLLEQFRIPTATSERKLTFGEIQTFFRQRDLPANVWNAMLQAFGLTSNTSSQFQTNVTRLQLEELTT